MSTKSADRKLNGETPATVVVVVVEAESSVRELITR